MALRDIKDKIGSVKKTAQVTRAMESVSAVKMRRAQEEALAARPYTHAAFTILKRLSKVAKISLGQIYDFHEKSEGRTAVVLVTASKGLAGAFNTNLFKELDKTLATEGLNTNNTDMICVGKKGVEYAKRNNFTVLHAHDSLEGDEVDVALRELSDLCLDLFHNKDYKEVKVVYTNFISTTEQVAVSRLILPIQYQTLHDFIHDVVPQTGRYSDTDDQDLEQEVSWQKEYLYEPDPQTLIEDLVPHLMYIGLYHALLESKASEHSARMIAMKNATDKAGEVVTDLNRKYNKARQAEITQEISEIVGGMETV